MAHLNILNTAQPNILKVIQHYLLKEIQMLM